MRMRPWRIGGEAVCGINAGCGKTGPDKKEDTGQQGGKTPPAGGEEAAQDSEAGEVKKSPIED